MKKMVPVSGACCVLGMVMCAASSSAADAVVLQFSHSAGNGPYSAQQNSLGAFYWSDHEAPHQGADYFVPAGLSLGVAAAEGAEPFKGDSLSIAGTLYYLGGWGAVFQSEKPVTLVDGARLLCSSYHFTASANPFISEGSMEAPAVFYLAGASTGANRDYYFPSKFESAEGSMMEITAGTTSDTINAARVRLQGSDFSKFYGAVRFVCGAGVYTSDPLSVAGTFELGTNSLLSISKSTGESSFGTLVFRKGSRLALSANNRHLIKVSQRLEIEDGVSFDLQKFSGFATGTPPDVPVFELSAAALAASGDLQKQLDKVLPSTSPAVGLPSLKWTFADAAGGGKVIGITYREVVEMTGGLSYGNEAFRLDRGEAACSSWTDSRYPHGNADYYLRYNAVAYYGGGPERYVFPGETLIVNTALGLYGNIKDFEANFVFLGNVGFRAMTSGAEYHLRGRIRISPYKKTSQGETFLDEDICAYNFNIADHGSLTLDADIAGSGLIGFGMNTEHSPCAKTDTAGTIVLNGDNSAFDGKMVVSCWQVDTLPASFQSVFSDAPFVPGPVSNLTLRVAGSTSLGGPRAAFADDALTLGNECRLAFSETVVFAEPTRGWYFPQNAYLHVPEGCVATVKQALKFGAGAVIVKEGAGRLALGGEITVENGGLERPTLIVSDGRLGYASRGAVDGISVAFMGDAGLVAVADVGDELKANGMNVDAMTFVGEGVIPVILDFGSAPVKERTGRIALFTVADRKTASALGGRIRIDRIQGCHVRAEAVDNANGTVTIFGVASPAGMCLSFR